MSGIRTYQSLRKLVTRLRDDLNNAELVLLYAYNRTGKTRLSMEFKDVGKRQNNGAADTLYFNAYTGDLFRLLIYDFVTTFQFALPEMPANAPAAAHRSDNYKPALAP